MSDLLIRVIIEMVIRMNGILMSVVIVVDVKKLCSVLILCMSVVSLFVDCCFRLSCSLRMCWNMLWLML